MLKTIKIRLYPTMKQQNVLEQHFGSCRYVYNQALAYKKQQWEESKTKLSKFDMIKWVTQLRQDPNHEWLKNIKCEVVQNQVDKLDSAFQGFFKGGGYPKFKSKKSFKQTFLSKQNFRILDEDRIVFMKNKIKFKCSEQDKIDLRTGKIKTITYSKDNTNQYYASIVIENNKDLKLPILNKEVGCDLGLKTFLVTSDGVEFNNPRFFKESQKKLAKEQRKLSKKKKGSKNKEKQRIKVAGVHKKISNQRNYFLHEVSNKLINENQVICLETLNVKGMQKNKHLSKSIGDVSWSTLVNMLEYKANWAGREIVKIGRFEPSSKTCNSCGWIWKDMNQSRRTFKCQSCGFELDRDLNAAKNILKIGRAELTRTKTLLDSKTLVPG